MRRIYKEEFVDAFKTMDGDYIEVFKNPSRSELKSLGSYPTFRFLVDRGNVYAFDSYVLHQDVQEQLEIEGVRGYTERNSIVGYENREIPRILNNKWFKLYFPGIKVVNYNGKSMGTIKESRMMRRMYELMDNPVPYTWDRFHQYDAIAFFEVGGMEYNVLIFDGWVKPELLGRDPVEDGGLDTIEIHFETEEGFNQRTNRGDAIPIFSTVGSIFREFIDKYKPGAIHIKSPIDDHMRQKLYGLFARSLQREYGYERIGEETVEGYLLYREDWYE